MAETAPIMVEIADFREVQEMCRGLQSEIDLLRSMVRRYLNGHRNWTQWPERERRLLEQIAETDRVGCPVVVGQQQGPGPGLLLACNKPLPCPDHGAEREHQPTDDCWCQPASQPVKREDGSVGWVIVHKGAMRREP